MLADGTWTLKLVTPATGTTVTASCDGLEIKTAPMAEDQARRLLMLCKEMGVLVTT
jgi:hypothetical protein